MRGDNQSAFVLHTRDYRDSSLLVEFLTAEHGRISGVVRGVRGQGKSARQRRGIMQAFVPLTISWSGKTDLKQIQHFEATASPVHLPGQSLFSGFYLNELLIRLLQHYDDSPFWFGLYWQALQGLASSEPDDQVLRRFELALLDALGYGIDLRSDVNDGAAIVAGILYQFDASEGFRRVSSPEGLPAHSLFRGEELSALAEGQFTDAVRRSAKRLCRLALLPHLGDKPLKSRELFS